MANIAQAAGADRTGDGVSRRPGQEEGGLAAPGDKPGFRTTTVCLELWAHVVFAGCRLDAMFSLSGPLAPGALPLCYSRHFLSSPPHPEPLHICFCAVVSLSQWVEMHKDSGPG